MNRVRQNRSVKAVLVLAGLCLDQSHQTVHAQWAPWAPLGDQQFDGSSPVWARLLAAGRVTLLAVGKDRQIYTNLSEKDKGWQGWTALGKLKLPAKTPIEVVMRRDDQVELFAVAAGGKMRSTTWDKMPGWNEWSFIGEQTFDAGSRVTALQAGEGRIILFAVGKDRRAYTTAREDGKDWKAWAPIGDMKLALNTHITAYARAADRIDLFAVAKDGKVCTTRWEQGKEWQIWAEIGEGVYDPGSGVTAVGHDKVAGRIDLFALGRDRKVYTTGQEDGRIWPNWTRVAALQFTEKAVIAGASRTYVDSPVIDLFAVGPFGAMRHAAGEPGKSWEPWDIVGPGTIADPIARNQTFPAGGPVTILDRRPNGEQRLDLFAVRVEGRVFTTFAEIKK